MIILSILVTLLIPLVALVVIPYLFVSINLAYWPSIIGVWQIIAVALILIGLILTISVSIAHARAGKSTPVPFKAPKKFIANGPYTFSRNPMYVGMLVVLIGEALLLQAPWMLVFIAFLYILFILYIEFDEEPRMIQRFGTSYQDYMKKVPRWLSLKRIE
jgi:protein-S-isoprenylcysteine O-methyltransferase Ste14